MIDLYKKTLINLRGLPVNNTKEGRAWVQKYLGSNKPTKCTRTGEMIKLAKDIIKKEDPDIAEFTNLIDLLYKNAKTFQEMDLAARLLQVAPNLRKEISPTKLDYWLNFTHGWAENDVLTQSNFTDEEILGNWSIWKKLIINFSKDKNIHKRRASLVLLVKSVRLSPDQRLSDLAFQNIERLKTEKEILITKAVSWILRSLITNHKAEVTDYIKSNKVILPKIVIREVETKLATGRKTKRIK